MIFYGIAVNGARAELGQPLSLFLSRERDAPADFLRASFRVEGSLPELREMEIFQGERRWFTGLVDEQNTALTANGLRVELVCRSLEAILLDNEALPEPIQTPSLPALSERLLTPFGLTLGEGDRSPMKEPFPVEKGESCWTVLERFCKRLAGTTPWVDESGAVQCAAAEPGRMRLRNVLSAELRRLPCKEIQEVWQQSCRGGYDTRYRGVGFSPGRPGTPRRRYVSMQRGKNPREVLQTGREDAFLLAVTCQGLWWPGRGDLASVSLPGLGEFESCPVRSVQYRRDSSGERTSLVLERPVGKEEMVCG